MPRKSQKEDVERGYPMVARGPRGEPGKGYPGLPGGPLGPPGPHGCPSFSLKGRPHLKQFEECKNSLRNGPRGPQGGGGARAPWGPRPPGAPWPIPQTISTFFKLLNTRPVFLIFFGGKAKKQKIRFVLLFFRLFF